MTDILDEKIDISASQAREPLSFTVQDASYDRIHYRHDTLVKGDSYTFKVETHPAFSAGTYSLRDIIDRLSKCAHLHDKTIFTGTLPTTNANCNCNCDCDCGDDGG